MGRGTVGLVKSGVAVTPETIYTSMATKQLDALIQLRFSQCSKLFEGFTRHADELYQALLEMESRFQKQERFRTDLKELKAQGWHQYLESRGVKPATFRKWKQRKLQSLVGPPKPALVAESNVTAALLTRDIESATRMETLKSVVAAHKRLNPAVMKSLVLALQNAAKRYTDFADQLSAELAVIPTDQCHQHIARQRLAEVPDRELQQKREAAASFKNASVRFITHAQAKQLVLATEYLGNTGSGRFYVGLFFRHPVSGKEFLGGTTVFGDTAGNRAAASVCGKGHAKETITLVRGCCEPWCDREVMSGGKVHTGAAASYLITHACRLMGEKSYHCFISYSDLEAREVGTVLQASNWIFTGQTAPTEKYLLNGKIYDSRMVSGLARDRRGGVLRYKRTRHAQRKLLIEQGAKFFSGTPKYRYIFFSGDRRKKRELRKDLKLKPLPYPKRNQEIANAA